MESGQSCPELGRPVRLCVPSNKPDKGLSKQGQNRMRRDHPDSPRLAESGVVPGPIRSRDRLSNISPMHQCINCSSRPHTTLIRIHGISTFTLEVIKGFHKERGFSEAVAQRLAISRRQSSAGVYESKWKVFGEWCHVKQINPVKAIVQQLASFFSSNRKMRISANCWTVALTGLICLT